MTPIDPRIRLAIAHWPAGAPRGAVSTFCFEHGISRKSFCELRKRATTEGPAAILEPRSRRSRSSPTKLSDQARTQALQVRAALESSGLDHGPISVHDKMQAMGLPVVPSVASLARIFRESGVARLEPSKKPRSAWRRFVYPAPNACWQLDATNYVLTRRRTCVIFQLIHDHSRYALASQVAWSETSAAAVEIFDKAVAAFGVPQRLLTDNGLALNPSRRGYRGRLVEHVSKLGTEAITGKQYEPTTQGKNERLHQTLFRYLDKQPIAETLQELQAPVDAFDHIHNFERPHQALPGRITPDTAWKATATAEAPRPRPETLERARPTVERRQSPPAPDNLPPGTKHKKLGTNGAFTIAGVIYAVGGQYGLQHVLVVTDGSQITVTDLDGEILIEHTRAAPGTTYVGNGRPRGPRPKTNDPSPKS